MLWIAFLASLTACCIPASIFGGDDDETSSPPPGTNTGPIGDTAGPTDSGTTDCGEQVPDALLLYAMVECNPSRTEVTFFANVEGVVGTENEVFMMDTANSFPWSESHPIQSNGNVGPCDASDEIELVLDANAFPPQTLEAYEPGTSTFYSCVGFFEDPVMTYAFAVSNPDGTFADCLAFGHDPDGLVNGDYDGDMNGATPGFDLSRCTPL